MLAHPVCELHLIVLSGLLSNDYYDDYNPEKSAVQRSGDEAKPKL